MVKEKRILSYFIGWLLVGYIIFVIGSSNVFASTYYLDYNYSQKYFDNRGSSVTGVTTTWNDSLQSYISGDITTAAGSYGAGLSITSPIPILENHTYTLSISFVDKNNIALSSKNYLAFSSTLQGAANNYANGEYDNELITSSVSNNSILNFAFTSKRNGSYIFIPWTTTNTVTQSYVLTQISMEDLGSEGVSIDDINTSLTNQTNELNTSIENSTNTITDAITNTEDNINSNIDDMESAIIDSNKETQEVIKDQFNTCRESYNILNFVNTDNILSGVNITTNNGIITFSGTSTSAGAFNIGTYTLEPGSYYQQSNSTDSFNRYSSIRSVSNGSVIKAGNGIITLTETTQVTFQIIFNDQFTGTFTYKPMVNKGNSSLSWEQGGEICTNKIDETNDKLDGIQDSLTDSSSPDTSGLENSAGWLPAGPLDSILNLPLTMLNSLTNSLNKTCSPLNLTLPYVNKQIQIPCLSAIFAQITGVNGLWTWVGTIASVLILYNYLLNLYAWVDRVLTLRAEFDEAMGADLANWGRL